MGYVRAAVMAGVAHLALGPRSACHLGLMLARRPARLHEARSFCHTQSVHQPGAEVRVCGVPCVCAYTSMILYTTLCALFSI